MRILFVTLLTIACFIGKAQNDLPQDYFRLPVDLTPYISGTFGEPRFTHFHAGLDIKTNQEEGHNIYAAADGYISRINMTTYGYGRAIYIKHPNGYTTVYAHLQTFSDEVQAYVDASHYQKEDYFMELYPGPERLKVKKGDVIALSGNTGGSGGPHLHWEIRDAAGRPMNPLLFGIKYTDNIDPYIGDLTIYDKSEKRFMRDSKDYDLIKKSGVYTTEKDTIKVNSDQISVSVQTYDQANGASNKNGVYEVKMTVDGQLKYHFTADKFAFDETRHVRCIVDYRKRNVENKTAHNCYRMPNNNFLGCKIKDDYGIIPLPEGTAKKVEIEVSDIFGNVSKVHLWVKKSNKSKAFQPKTIYYSKKMDHRQKYSFTAENIRVSIPQGCLFDTLHFNYGMSTPIRTDIVSYIHYLHDDHVPLLKYYNIAIKPINLPMNIRDKALVVRKDWENDIHAEGGKLEGEYVMARSKYFGEFFLMVDTIPPRIRPVNISEGKNMAGMKSIQFKITDELSGIENFRGTIDGKWVLMEYEHKKNLLWYDFDNLSKGEHSLELVVTDDRKNKSIYSVKFKY